MNLVVGELCCFGNWTSWAESSLTCGQVCRNRRRDIKKGLFAIFDDCNNNYNSCPNYESQDGSCENIDCRKFDFKIMVNLIV